MEVEGSRMRLSNWCGSQEVADSVRPQYGPVLVSELCRMFPKASRKGVSDLRCPYSDLKSDELRAKCGAGFGAGFVLEFGAIRCESG